MKIGVELFDNLKDRFSVYEVLLALMITFGFFIRLYFGLKFSIWHDEAVTANSIISFLENGVPDYPSGFEYWRSITSWIIPAGLAAVFGTSKLVLRFPSMVYSTLMIPLVYIVGKEFYSKNSGLVAAAFITFSAWQVSFATQIRMYALFQLLYFITFYFIYKTGEKPSTKNIVATIFLTIYTMTVHVTGYIIPITGFIYFTYRWRLYKNIKFIEKQQIILFIGFIVSALILNKIHFTYIGRLEGLVFKPENIISYYYLIRYGYPILWVLGLIGLVFSWKNRKIFALNLLAVLPPVYIYILHVEYIAIRYLFFSMPFLALMAGAVVEKYSKSLNNLSNDIIGLNFLLVIVTTTLLLSGVTFKYDFEERNTRPIYDQEGVYNYIESREEEGDVLITQWTPPAMYYNRTPDAIIYADYVDKDERFVNGVEKYSGVKRIIRNGSRLKSYMKKNPQGWIVLRDNSYRNQKEGIKEILSGLEKAEFKDISVWYWSNEFSGQRDSKN